MSPMWRFCSASSSGATCAPALQRIADASDRSLILILSDINMPEMSGLDLLPKAKALRPDVPIIMITAYGDAETKRRALENGAEALLTKPIDFGTASVGGKKGLRSGSRVSALTPDRPSSAISAAAVSSITPPTATPSTSRHGWKPPISSSAPAFA